MAEENGAQLPPISKWWTGLYCFAAFWLFMVASLDASHFGPGFFPLLISLLLVPLLAVVFLIDMCVRIVEAIQGKEASLARRLGPLAVSVIGVAVYGGIFIIFMIERT